MRAPPGNAGPGQRPLLAEVEIAPPAEVELRPYQRASGSSGSPPEPERVSARSSPTTRLGKTLQILTAIASTSTPIPEAPPVLVVAPTSVVPAWKHEAQRFFPGLRVRLVGEKPAGGGVFSSAAVDADILVTCTPSPDSKPRSGPNRKFSGLVLDEAWPPRTRELRSTRLPLSAHPWAFAVTGTPVENSLTCGPCFSLTDPGLPALLDDLHAGHAQADRGRGR